VTHVDHGWRHAPKAKGGTDPIPGLGGIQFDIDNEGGWLEVGTSSGSTSDTGYGISLSDFGDGGSSGILLWANNDAGIHLQTVGGGPINLQGTGDLLLTAGDDMVATVGGALTLTSQGALAIESAFDAVTITGATGITLTSGGGDNIELNPGFPGVVLIGALPTSPVSGFLWNNSGAIEMAP
jgi:hypothetical protein